jgi:hypothetical protein
MPSNTIGFVLDVNGPSQSAVLYSNVTTASITPRYFGVFHDITSTGPTITITLTNVPANTGNIGKYVVFRNNTAATTLTYTFTSASIPSNAGGSSVTCAAKQSVTLMVATATTYTLF